jgi:hypothetical protein
MLEILQVNKVSVIREIVCDLHLASFAISPKVDALEINAQYSIFVVEDRLQVVEHELETLLVLHVDVNCFDRWLGRSC